MNLGFYGSHFQNNALILPSKNCIVSLVETPFLVITLSEIEIVSFERVDNKIKNFDMAIIYKDYTKPVTTITNIPKEDLEMLREFLESTYKQCRYSYTRRRVLKYKMGCFT